MKTRAISLILIGLFLYCFAEEMELPLQDIAVIQDSSGLARILFKFDSNEIPDSAMIDYVALFIPRFLHSVPEYSLTLEAKLLTMQWEPATVSWNYPWQTPGADYDTTLYGQFRVSSRVESDIYLDITELIKIISSGNPNYGILLMSPEYENAGFIIPVGNLVNVLNSAQIKLAINPAAMDQE